MRSTTLAVALSILLLQSIVAAQGINKATVNDSDARPALSEGSEDDCLLVFFRPPRHTGSILKPSVYLDGQRVARLGNGRYFSLRLGPGKHQISSSMKQSPLELDLNSGDVVYLEMVILVGTWRGGGRFIPAPAGDALSTIASLKPLEKEWVSERKVAFDLQIEHGTPAAEEKAPSKLPQAAPVGSVIEQRGSEALLEIGSDPLGAEIEIDEAYYGNTPSSIGVLPGDHTIRLRKSGYKTWERKVRVSSGRITVAAELEKEPASK